MKSQTIMTAATLDRDRDTASGVTEARHFPAAARNDEDQGGSPAGIGAGVGYSE